MKIRRMMTIKAAIQAVCDANPVIGGMLAKEAEKLDCNYANEGSLLDRVELEDDRFSELALKVMECAKVLGVDLGGWDPSFTLEAYSDVEPSNYQWNTIGHYKTIGEADKAGVELLKSGEYTHYRVYKTELFMEVIL